MLLNTFSTARCLTPLASQREVSRATRVAPVGTTGVRSTRNSELMSSRCGSEFLNWMRRAGFLLLRTRPVPGRATHETVWRPASYGCVTLTALLPFSLPVVVRPMLVERASVTRLALATRKFTPLRTKGSAVRESFGTAATASCSASCFPDSAQPDPSARRVAVTVPSASSVRLRLGEP